MNIFVCEDEQQYLEHLVRSIQNYILFKNQQVILKMSTANPDQLLNEVEKNIEEDNLFFLDVDLKTDVTGIELAEKIKVLDPNAKIVFITTHGELYSLVFQYQIETMDYIEKDQYEIVENRIRSCIDKAIERFFSSNSSKEDTVILKIGNQIERIPVSKILFFESSHKSHRVEVHLKNRQFEIYGKLSDVVKMHPTFIASHKSFVVNIKNVKSVNTKERIVTLMNGETCYMSHRFQKNLLSQLDSHH
ncbi:LytTR family DNA-binding domain-containing protein [Enterococcus durans]|uniref:LytR/AlgR family response regulator transcription factor n=1 Tax=Enterococcus TaxID=1350 RepID=UPI00288CC59F|nr:LytTR family DNA-binding domain-containing protein [Enterococcus durans]MDT2835596.1 LytTR family DNA-binding domain-containing protein [Enterococcus durans]